MRCASNGLSIKLEQSIPNLDITKQNKTKMKNIGFPYNCLKFRGYNRWITVLCHSGLPHSVCFFSNRISWSKNQRGNNNKHYSRLWTPVSVTPLSFAHTGVSLSNIRYIATNKSTHYKSTTYQILKRLMKFITLW